MIAIAQNAKETTDDVIRILGAVCILFNIGNAMWKRNTSAALGWLLAMLYALDALI